MIASYVQHLQIQPYTPCKNYLLFGNQKGIAGEQRGGEVSIEDLELFLATISSSRCRCDAQQGVAAVRGDFALLVNERAHRQDALLHDAAGHHRVGQRTDALDVLATTITMPKD